MPDNPFYVAPPDIAGSILRGAQIGQQLQQYKSMADLRKMTHGADFTSPEGRQKFTSAAMGVDPGMAAQYMELFDRMDERQKAQAKALSESVAKEMLRIKQLPPAQQATAYAMAQARYPDALKEPYDPSVIDMHIADAQTFEQAWEAYNKKPEGFTLGEGQVRFDAQGRPIAGVPKAAEAKWLDAIGPGGVSYKYNEATGQTNLSKPGGGFYTLSEIGGGQAPGQGAAPATGQQTAPAAYEPTIQKAAAQFGVPPELLRGLLQQESNFNPGAISPKGAVGIAQFMPETAAEMGIDPRDPQESIYGAAQYLRQQFDKFGSWNAALAAYNFGPGNVAAGKALPQETRDYVAQLGPLAGGQSQGGFDFSQFQTPKQAAQTNPVEQANTLRGEFTKLTKDYRDVGVAYQKIQSAANNPSLNSGASDIALIFGYMKMLDPTSTVREGEYATAANSGGIPAQVQNLYNKAIDGQFLTVDQRQDFVTQAGLVFGAYSRQYDALKQQYTELAQQNGIDPRNVIVEGGVPDAGPRTPDATADPDRAKQILQRWGIAP